MPWFIFTLMLFIAPADVHTATGTAATPHRIKAVSASISMAHLLAYTRRSQFG